MIFRRSSNKPSGLPASSELSTTPPANAGPTIIGAEAVIDGEIRSSSEMQIDGTVNGNISASVVVVDVHGVVNGHIIAEDIWIRGRVIGPVYGKHVTIVANAHVEGDIINQTIAIENGAYIDGRINRVDDPLNAASYDPQYDGYDSTSSTGYNAYGDQDDADDSYNVEPLRPRSKAAE